MAGRNEEAEEAPAEVHEYFDHIADLKKTMQFSQTLTAQSLMESPAKLAAAAEEVD